VNKPPSSAQTPSASKTVSAKNNPSETEMADMYREWKSGAGHIVEHHIEEPDWLPLIADVEAVSCQLFDILLTEEGLAETSISLCWTNDAHMSQLNENFRGKESPTNVLSFPVDEEGDSGEDDLSILGDIALGREIILKEAEDGGITPHDHIIHLLAHGVLHLLGYDHEDDEDAKEMEACETRLLARVGIANPYDEVLIKSAQELA
jgi:probable rRNA maturation factor